MQKIQAVYWSQDTAHYRTAFTHISPVAVYIVISSHTSILGLRK